MVERVKASKTPKTIVVATTTNKEDEVVVEICKQHNIKYFRGHPTDLLDRHYKTALEFDAEVVAKIPSDCPLICPDVIDKVLQLYIQNKDGFDYVSNLHPASYPDGHDVEVMPLKILEQAWKEAGKDFEREHTTPFIWERPDMFRIGNEEWGTGLDFSMSHRMTVDYKEDYEFIKMIYDKLYNENKVFTLCDIMMLLDKKPEIKKINEMHAGMNWYREHLGELSTVSSEQTKIVNSE